MSIRILLACAIGACVFSTPARAHHGRDFILVQTAHLPEKGTGYVIARLAHLDEEEDEVELEPAILYGLADWVAVDVHAHYSKHGDESFGYEALAPEAVFRLTPRNQALAAGVSVEYEIAHESAEDDVVGVSGIVGWEKDGWITAGNLLYEKPSHASGEWGYALGARRALAPGHALGLELAGSLESGGSAEALVLRLIEEEQLTAEELERLRKKPARDRKKKHRGKGGSR